MATTTANATSVAGGQSCGVCVPDKDMHVICCDAGSQLFYDGKQAGVT